ncbi:MAG: ABC transporter ATP-binding protein [Archangium sp.]|nr:ABC transporter ATP-binding protein [Archangium sp.]
MSVLELQGVSARYETRAGQQVLQSVSASLEPGQALVVLGPNGAGKSTLVRLAMGLLRASSGTVRVAGMDPAVAGPRALARHVAWVPQTIDDETGFTGLELVLMGRAPHLSGWGVPSVADEARALEVMKELEVAELASRPLAEVSGGERRRVWLARALVQEPKLLVLDEPTAFLDVKHQLDSLKAVRARVGKGLAVLAVLHDVNLARLLATHVLLLKDGRALASGPVNEVLTPARLSDLYGVPMIEAPTPGGSLFVPAP